MLYFILRKFWGKSIFKYLDNEKDKIVGTDYFNKMQKTFVNN